MPTPEEVKAFEDEVTKNIQQYLRPENYTKLGPGKRAIVDRIGKAEFEKKPSVSVGEITPLQSAALSAGKNVPFMRDIQGWLLPKISKLFGKELTEKQAEDYYKLITEMASAENPKSSLAGAVGGGAVLGATLPAKGLPFLASEVGYGAALGAGEAEEGSRLKGAGIGGGIGLAGAGALAGLRGIGKASLEGMTGSTLDDVGRYARAGKSVEQARPLNEIAAEMVPDVQRVKAENIAEGYGSRNLLENVEVPRERLLGAVEDIRGIAGQSESMAQGKSIENMLKDLRLASETPETLFDLNVPAVRVKNAIAFLDDVINWGQKPETAMLSETAAKQLRGRWSEILKDLSPEYRAKMEEVARSIKDTSPIVERILGKGGERVSDVQSQKNAINYLRDLIKGERGVPGAVPDLEAFGVAKPYLSKDYAQEAVLRDLSERFGKAAPMGSTRANVGTELGGWVGKLLNDTTLGRGLGALGGVAADRGGREAMRKLARLAGYAYDISPEAADRMFATLKAMQGTDIKYTAPLIQEIIKMSEEGPTVVNKR
jgi:hypothetical protein